jgi:hypothetical protein
MVRLPYHARQACADSATESPRHRGLRVPEDGGAHHHRRGSADWSGRLRGPRAAGGHSRDSDAGPGRGRPWPAWQRPHVGGHWGRPGGNTPGRFDALRTTTFGGMSIVRILLPPDLRMVRAGERLRSQGRRSAPPAKLVLRILDFGSPALCSRSVRREGNQPTMPGRARVHPPTGACTGGSAAYRSSQPSPAYHTPRTVSRRLSDRQWAC